MLSNLKNETALPGKKRSVFTWWKSQSLRHTVFMVFVYAMLIGGSVLFLAPLAWMISTSLKPLDDVWKLQMDWIPDPILWRNYIEALDTLPFFLYIRNSLFVAVISMVGSVLSSAFVGYGFSRFRFPGRNVLFFILLGTMMLPGTVTFIPVYILFAKIGWVYTFLPLIIPPFMGERSLSTQCVAALHEPDRLYRCRS